MKNVRISDALNGIDAQCIADIKISTDMKNAFTEDIKQKVMKAVNQTSSKKPRNKGLGLILKLTAAALSLFLISCIFYNPALKSPPYYTFTKPNKFLFAVIDMAKKSNKEGNPTRIYQEKRIMYPVLKNENYTLKYISVGFNKNSYLFYQFITKDPKVTNPYAAYDGYVFVYIDYSDNLDSMDEIYFKAFFEQIDIRKKVKKISYKGADYIVREYTPNFLDKVKTPRITVNTVVDNHKVQITFRNKFKLEYLDWLEYRYLKIL